METDLKDEFTGSDERLRLFDRTLVTDHRMPPFAIAKNLTQKAGSRCSCWGEIKTSRSSSKSSSSLRVEKKLSTTALSQQHLPVIAGPVLAALIGVDQQLIGRHLAMTERAVEGFDRQGGIHPLIQRPTDDTAAEQVDPHSEVPPA